MIEVEPYGPAHLALVGGMAAGGAWLLWRFVWIFRNPPRTPPPEPGVLSPVDGRVAYVRPAGTAQRLAIGIRLGPFDVRYPRSPIDGVLQPGCDGLRILGRLDARALQCDIVAGGPALLRGVRPGELVSRGAVLGHLASGSHIELVLPDHLRILVGPGSGVRAGETLVATMPEAIPQHPAATLGERCSGLKSC